jgi:epoxide hydrolase 4
VNDPTDLYNQGYLSVHDVTLHYVTQGEGELMLMLHGFPEFWYSWRHQIAEFSLDYKAVALDLRGYNKSDKPKSQSAYHLSILIEDIKGVIEGLGYERCVLVGHDWGGAIAWAFAYAYPEIVTRLIVLNLPHPDKFSEGLRTLPQLLRSWYILLFQLPLLPEWLLSQNNYGLLVSILTKTAINPEAFPPEAIEAYSAAAAQPGAVTAMLNYYRNLWESNFLQKSWDVLDVPALMIWGENDVALGKELTFGTQDYVKDLQICYIPNCGHWVQQEQPQLVNQYIRDWLSSSL